MDGADCSGFVFQSRTVNRFLRNKHIVFIGDSSECESFHHSDRIGCCLDLRGMYKDVVVLLQEDRLLTSPELEKKVIRGSFMGDKVLSITPPHDKTSGINFYEFREYRSSDGYHLVQYYFVTKLAICLVVT